MDPRKVPISLILCLVSLAAWGAEAPNLPPPTTSTANNNLGAPPPDANQLLSPDAALMEEGKALYENGQLIAALGKFMTVLRSDPHNPDAREYLRMIVDALRQNPAISSSKLGTKEQPFSTTPLVQEELRKMLQLRSRLSMDLKAIPGVQLDIKGNQNQVRIDTSFLFGENSGGLKEQGIPLLDRVAAWLKTYGQQPVIIHCYPEELQKLPTDASLFLSRYSELFNYFVDERKLSAQRFVSADLLNKAGTQKPDGTDQGVAVSTRSQIVIETIGSQSALLDSMPVANSSKGPTTWLEDSVTLNRQSFNPEEGEWINLDLASLTKEGLRSWSFTISPAQDKAPTPVFKMEGKGNLLKRLGWDGHNQKTEDFVPAGNYIAKLMAVDGNGIIKEQDQMLQVERTTKEAPVVAEKPKEEKAAKSKKKKKVVATSSPADSGGGPITSSPSNDGPPTGALGGDTDADAAHAIWKQVIQFEPNESALMPTVKSSLERIGKTLEVYPLQKVRIMGFAMTSEANSADLATKRAEAVKLILVDEYHVDSKRVIVAGGKTTTAENSSKVELSITN